MAINKFGLIKKLDLTGNVVAAVNQLTTLRVMVGVPDSKAGRKEGPINNAALAYIHDVGSPEANIPARPFMGPGVRSVQGQIEAELKKAGEAAFKGKTKAVETIFARVGIIAVNGIRAKISEGIPPPLAESTVQGRIRRVKGKKRRARIQGMLDTGTPASRIAGAAGVFTPLVVTGALRNAITYVIRKVSRR